ncbi:chemotaxis protein CheA [Pendulispora albinea]|uniref:Chemotaxis protein CheA n=1 Tax=Pendulispora albinea TaxID=2741071 RepID=A0ABZ2M7H6_9BACT
MSTSIDLKEFRGAYLAEVGEHLSLSNAKMLEIEDSLKRGQASFRAIRELFRLLHTIKGLSAMVGVDTIVTLAHRMEAILRRADQRTMELSLDAVEPLFHGLRAIQEVVVALSKGRPIDPPSNVLIARLEAVEAHGKPASESPGGERVLDLEPALDAKLARFEREQLINADREGRRVVRIDFVPSPKKAELGFTINSVRERLGSIAEIVKVVPVAVPATEDAPGGLCFVLMLVTLAEDSELAAAVGGPEVQVRPLVHAPPPPAPDPAFSEIPGGSVDDDDLHARNVLRVDVQRVDEAMERLAALIVSRSRLTRVLDDVAQVDGALGRELKSIVEESGRQLRDLRASILRIRTVRFAEILARLPLVVRGLRRSSGKDVTLATDAGDAELDKSVAERLFPALIHLVRNAIDHGIELPDERERSGKPRQGTLTVSATVLANREISVQVSDDGAGVDREAVARQLGGVVPEADDGLLNALCRAGLSTRRVATTGSGRGMGMDIVKKIVVDQLGGTLSLANHPGKGAIFTLRVPLTVAIVDAFVVRLKEDKFVVPVVSVEDIVEVIPGAAVRGATPYGLVALMAWRGTSVPLVELATLFGMTPVADSTAVRHGVIVRRGSERVGFVLDRVLSQQEAVIRPLVDPLVQVPGISGSTDLGDGKSTLVLDLSALAHALLTHGRYGEPN